MNGWVLYDAVHESFLGFRDKLVTDIRKARLFRDIEVAGKEQYDIKAPVLTVRRVSEEELRRG